VQPAESQTNLVRELFRATINRVYQDPVQLNKFTAELVIPASVGGFVLREVGVFDSNGAMFVVGNLPDTYKPQASEGAYADTILRMDFFVTNVSVVNVIIDPNIVTASQAWVLNTVNACTVIPGGTTGQVLRKKTNGCGDTEWADPTEANVTVNAIEERQTLVTDQTVVTLGTVTTEGLAVYIEGVRIPKAAGASGWQPDVAVPDTKIVLGQSYPDSTAILLVQNDPLGGVNFPLARDQNLADVPDKALARTNLDVYSKAETLQFSTPAGMVVHFARNTAPTGWLKANGAAVSRTAYAALFSAIGTTFGGGDGFNTFNLPDLRGEFLRGWSDGRAVDTGRVFGSAQTDDNKSHSHSGSTDTDGAHIHAIYANDLIGASAFDGPQNPDAALSGSAFVGNTASAGSHWHNIYTSSSGGPEARPRNVAMLACIKF